MGAYYIRRNEMAPTNLKVKYEKEMYRNDLYITHSEDFAALMCATLASIYPNITFEATDRNSNMQYYICGYSVREMTPRTFSEITNKILSYAEFFSQVVAAFKLEGK
jgi:hypothetical protein